MIEERGAKTTLGRKKHFFVFLAIPLFLVLVGFVVWNAVNFSDEIICGDGTFNGNCSINKPYFCANGTLIENAILCDCPGVLEKKDNLCASQYHKDSKEIKLNYTLRGEKKYLNFIVYGGMREYFSSVSKTIYYQEGEIPSRGDFKIRNINDKEQREMLLPLVVKIQNLAKDEKDQVRIAVSLIQNIPYGFSNGTFYFGADEFNSSRYSYEVLYDLKGVCEEKAELLSFLLKELGYGVSLFYYPEENHEAVGIKCPVEYGLNGTAYCFIETTGPSIISDNERHYVALGKLSEGYELFLISEGETLSKNMYEYKDADTLAKFLMIIEDSGGLNVFQHEAFANLKEKYGLENL